MDTTTVQAPPAPALAHETASAPADRAPSEVESKAAAKVRKVAGTTEARIAERDAESARKLRERQAAVELRRQEVELKHAEAAAKAATKDAKKARSAQLRATRRQARLDRAGAAYTTVRDYIAGNAPSVYSTGIYAMALYVAVSGQLNMAEERGWSLIFAIGMAAFLEGTALSMALTAHQLRLKGERALIPTIATWTAAGFAAAINYLSHRDDPILAVVLGASSLAAIIVWEVRSGAKHRAALRAMGLIPEPPERFGVRRWLRYPRSTFRAWSLDVRDRVGDGAAALLARVETNTQNSAAAASAEAAAAAQAAAVEAAAASARESARARAAAAEAHRAARRNAPRRSMLGILKRSAKDTVVETAPEPKTVPARTPRPVRQRTADRPKPPTPAVTVKEENPFAKVEEAFVELYAATGKRPGVRALEDAVQGVKKKSAIHTWMQNHPGLLDTLAVRAEAIRSGQTEVSA